MTRLKLMSWMVDFFFSIWVAVWWNSWLNEFDLYIWRATPRFERRHIYTKHDWSITELRQQKNELRDQSIAEGVVKIERLYFLEKEKSRASLGTAKLPRPKSQGGQKFSKLPLKSSKNPKKSENFRKYRPKWQKISVFRDFYPKTQKFSRLRS